LALGLLPPRLVTRCTFQVQKKRLDIHLEFPPGSVFPCAACGRGGCKVRDTTERTWRHLNSFEHEAYLHARLPRTECPDCGVKTVAVPWARESSGFTLLFEAFVMTLAKEMPVNAIARLVGEYDTRIWRILTYYVEQARRGQDYSQVQELGIDETSRKRGHNYITAFVDLRESKVLFVTEGKDAGTLNAFSEDLRQHNAHPSQILEVCCDMSPALITGAEATFPQAPLPFDKFHVMKIINQAVDEVRRQEQRARPELKRSRYIWLKNKDNLTLKEQAKFESLKEVNLKTARAYHLKLNFQEMYQQPPELSNIINIYSCHAYSILSMSILAN
jgi:transposase